MSSRLDGKVAFLTGAARGQGRSHAVRSATALAEKNIRVNAVYPTGVATPMLINDYVAQNFGEHPEALPAVQNLLPVQLMEAADVSEATVYLCAESGRHITGVSLPVDTGLSIGK